MREIRDLDLALPPDDPATANVLGGGSGRPGRLAAGGSPPKPAAFIGLPVWNDDHLANLLCEKGTPKPRRLPCYSGQFNAVELNSSGYGLSSRNAALWAAETPSGFRFFPKVPRDVTHGLDLTRASESYEEFCRAASRFGDRLGTVLLQFPESFDPGRFRELESFLRLNAFLLPMAVEVRHREWFEKRGPREALFGLLEELGIASVITDSPGRRDAVHMRLTKREAFIRFCGHDRSEMDLRRVEEWTDRLRVWMDQGLEQINLFAHHVPVHTSAFWAADFIAALNRVGGLGLAVPQLDPLLRQESPQLDLFSS